jgi:hypothetical protein
LSIEHRRTCFGIAFHAIALALLCTVCSVCVWRTGSLTVPTRVTRPTFALPGNCVTFGPVLAVGTFLSTSKTKSTRRASLGAAISRLSWRTMALPEPTVTVTARTVAINLTVLSPLPNLTSCFTFNPCKPNYKQIMISLIHGSS